MKQAISIVAIPSGRHRRYGVKVYTLRPRADGVSTWRAGRLVAAKWTLASATRAAQDESRAEGLPIIAGLRHGAPGLMSAAIWDKLTPSQRENFRDLSDLNPQLAGLEGKRVEVIDSYGETRRFWVGRSTGWRPCHLEVKLRNSLGGDSADKQYKSIRVINHGPRQGRSN